MKPNCKLLLFRNTLRKYSIRNKFEFEETQNKINMKKIHFDLLCLNISLNIEYLLMYIFLDTDEKLFFLKMNNNKKKTKSCL
jgi:hypothetical protein